MDIAKDAGVSKGLLYNYFTNKEELLREIILTEFQKAMNDMAFDFSQKINKKGLIIVIEKYFEMIENKSNYWKLYMAVITQPAVFELVKDEIFVLLEPFFTLVSQYYTDKGIKNPMPYAFLLGAIFDGVAVDYLFDPEIYPLNEIKNLIIEKFI